MSTLNNPSVGDFALRVSDYQQRVNKKLETYLPSAQTFPKHLHEAMRYSVLGGGKRVRPLLTYACGEAFGIDPKLVDAPAAAVELIHAFSLVHDDLPAMDDDHLRRGRATTHIAFDEATAILAGDALQALAFEILSSEEELQSHPLSQARMIRCLASAAGSTGMTGGQAHDLMSEGKKLTHKDLQRMHERKTGYLIRAAIMMVCELCDNLDGATRVGIDVFANRIGLAFQVCDDILDVESSTDVLGKPQGSDALSKKATYPSVLGMSAAKAHLNQLHKEAVESLKDLTINTQPLIWMASYVTHRDH